jgi:hypothetical protein
MDIMNLITLEATQTAEVVERFFLSADKFDYQFS